MRRSAFRRPSLSVPEHVLTASKAQPRLPPALPFILRMNAMDGRAYLAEPIARPCPVVASGMRTNLRHRLCARAEGSNEPSAIPPPRLVGLPVERWPSTVSAQDGQMGSWPRQCGHTMPENAVRPRTCAPRLRP